METNKGNNEQTEQAGTKQQPGIEIPKPELPKGGGALRGVDEKFTVNASNGTSVFQVPLPFSPGRNGFTPSGALTYNSGTGNSTTGVGWSITEDTIQRKTDKRLPSYSDEEDVFMITGSEDLVPLLQWNNGTKTWDTTDETIGPYTVKRFRPRIEGSFSRIEMISHPVTGTFWRSCSPDNITTVFGFSSEARIADPADPAKIFRWLPELRFDNKGNCITYTWKAEDSANVPDSLHEKNRRNGTAPFTNRYVKRIRYGNRVPYYVNAADPLTPSAPAGDFAFEAVFDYGEHDADFPLCEETPALQWAARPDAFSDYRSGFEIRTWRLLQRVLFFHRFDELHGGTATLVRSTDFGYGNTSAGAAQPTELSCLHTITQCGYIRRPDGTSSKKTMPALEFSYEKLNWSSEVRTPAPGSEENLPEGFGGNYQWLDFFGEGIPGVFTEQGEGWFYKPNLGDLEETGTVQFGSLKKIAPRPSFTGMGKGTLQLQDIEADGNKQIVFRSSQLSGYFELTDENEWNLFQPFATKLNIDLRDPDVRMLDLDGDGRPDVLITGNDVFTFYLSEGKAGYAASRKKGKAHDEEKGPVVVFSDPEQRIFLADMSGDGLTDIVRIRNGEVCYWPNRGYGSFGAKVNMSHAPVFDHPDRFNPAYVQLADVSGTGATDILYLGDNRCSAYLNLAGNSWSSEQLITDAFATARPANISVTDLNGNGTVCLVWSSALPQDVHAPLRYIDLLNGKKPHLLVQHKNNLGKETTIEYKSSTWFYLKDREEQKPWITKLPFPVYCVRKTTMTDRITGTRFASTYRFHHGYYDHSEREFRGFGMVEQLDTEHYEHWAKSGAANIVPAELHQAPVLTKTWYHTGAYLDKEKILTQFRHEYWDEERTRLGFPATATEAQLPDALPVAAPGTDPGLLTTLDTAAWREAFRACKGMMLRREIFALDAPSAGASDAELQLQYSPYSVVAQNCCVEVLQPKNKNRHAVFFVKESETVTYHYERQVSDPRVAHTFNLAYDEYGNVLESASVVYPRKLSDSTLPADIQVIQAKTIVLFATTAYTNDVISTHTYRLRKPCENKTWELKGLALTGALYTRAAFADVLNAAQELPYQQYDTMPPPGTITKRLTGHTCTLFYSEDLTAALLHGQQATHGLAFETYRKAYTPALVAAVFGNKADDALLLAGNFTPFNGDSNWWVRSGKTGYLAAGETVNDARQHFYAPAVYTDPLGAPTKVTYLGTDYLFTGTVEDALQNKTTITVFNYYALRAQRICDCNGNFSETIVDELGIVKATALFGKGNEADNLAGITAYTDAAEEQDIFAFFTASDSVQLTAKGKALLLQAGARFVYDLHVYKNSGGVRPAVTATIVREQHTAQQNDSPVQLAFEYSNGMGGIVMKKVQCEPGPAKTVTVHPDNSITVTEVDTAMQFPQQLRWLGNGRTVHSNKGKPVKQYEPYFSVSHQYEDYKELTATGVTPVMYYDAAGRLIRTGFPNGTFTKTTFDAWKQTAYDANDTLPGSAWYMNRVNGLINAELLAEGKDPAKEKAAAEQTVLHAGTPAVQHFDTPGRAVLLVHHNGRDASDKDILYYSRHETDAEGNTRSVSDARTTANPTGNLVIRYQYDMLGNVIYQQSMDAGKRWLLHDVIGNPLRHWDERNHTFLFTHDALHRLIEKRVTGGDGDIPLDNVFEKYIYGESLPNAAQFNFRGRVVTMYDTAGKTETRLYDFKGNILHSERTFAAEYKKTVKWNVADPDAALEPETHTTITTCDAMNRITMQQTADGSVFTPGYAASGRLNTMQVTQGALTEWFVKTISYNEKGQRSKIIYGNDVATHYYYDKNTFALLRLETRCQDNDPLQDFYYTYDPAGNITHLEDKAIPVVFFNNQKITGTATYTYDPLYRLVAATGREHAAQTTFGAPDNWDDMPFLKQYSSNDPMVWRNYTQQYKYDEAGNITQMKHIAPGGNWNRVYTYAAANNRLDTATVDDDNTTYAPYAYPHHAAHGFITAMPHLQVMQWNFSEQLQAVARQRVVNGTPETTYYVYDGSGQRVRKITEWQSAQQIGNPPKKAERYYLGAVERYSEYDSSGTETLQRWSCHVTDGQARIAMIEQQTFGVINGQARLVRYQFANHLGSACIETDQDAVIISWEEYHPFGTTAYQATDKNIKAAYKRYRYTGMERDDESGLAYHSARYYVPWLGRWLNADPIGLKGGLNLYMYSANNPLKFIDKTGTTITVSANTATDVGGSRQVLTTRQAEANRDFLRDIRIGLNTHDAGLFSISSSNQLQFSGKKADYDALSEFGKMLVDQINDTRNIFVLPVNIGLMNAAQGSALGSGANLVVRRSGTTKTVTGLVLQTKLMNNGGVGGSTAEDTNNDLYVTYFTGANSTGPGGLTVSGANSSLNMFQTELVKQGNVSQTLTHELSAHVQGFLNGEQHADAHLGKSVTAGAKKVQTTLLNQESDTNTFPDPAAVLAGTSVTPFKRSARMEKEVLAEIKNKLPAGINLGGNPTKRDIYVNVIERAEINLLKQDFPGLFTDTKGWYLTPPAELQTK